MIKKGKRTLEYEKQYEEFMSRTQSDYNVVTCTTHSQWTWHVRKDTEAMCPLCKKEKDDMDEESIH